MPVPWYHPLSVRIRDIVLRHYLVPYSRFGLEPGLVEHLPRRHPVTLVDIGANRGEFADTVRRHCGLKAAVLVEPQPALAGALRMAFPETQHRVCEVAVSDTAGVQPFSILSDDRISSLLPVRPGSLFTGRNIDVSVAERRDVTVVTFDELMDSVGWQDSIDLLKIDTQGNELQVIMGGRRWLQRVRLLWIEVSFRSLYEGDTLFADVHAALTAEGFRLYSLHEVFRSAERELLQADALFLGPKA